MKAPSSRMPLKAASKAFLSVFSRAAQAGTFLQPPSIASSTKASRVPEVGGGPSTSIFLSASSGLTSFQVL